MSPPTERMIDELNSLAECCVCLDKYKSPRTLPCIHTFCLQCLKHLAQWKLPGEEAPCPLCNQLFTIPDDGIASLPGNPFISRILDLGNLAGPQEGYRQQIQESSERRKLKRNAAVISRLQSDAIKCTQVRAKVVTNVLENHETLSNAIVKKIEDLNFLLDDLIAQKLRRTKTLDDEDDAMQGHLENLSSYKDYCLDLAEKGTASEVTQAMAGLDKTLEELEAVHESRMRSAFDIQQKLLDQMVLDSVLSSGLLDTSAGNTQNSADGENVEPKRKRMRVIDAEAEEEQDWPFKSEAMDNYDSLIHSQIIEYNMTAPSSTIPQQSAIIDTSPTSNTTSDPSSTVESNVLFEPTT